MRLGQGPSGSESLASFHFLGVPMWHWYGERPSNIEMNRASLDALHAVGYTGDQAKALVAAAIKDRVNHGLLGGQPIPRLSDRINQVPPDVP